MLEHCRRRNGLRSLNETVVRILSTSLKEQIQL